MTIIIIAYVLTFNSINRQMIAFFDIHFQEMHVCLSKNKIH